ncbi:hypothetical protein BH23VER1_BH23VER1_09150 [soil metagenome]
MTAHEIFRHAPAERCTEVIQYFREHEREAYRSALTSLAAQRKLRPVFIQKKTAEAQIGWIISMLKLKSNEALAAQLLQIWLMKGHADLLVAFLDEAGIPHDGEGGVDDLPDELDGTRVGSAIDKILADFPDDLVAIYLHVFQHQRSGGWPEIAAELEAREALKLG